MSTEGTGKQEADTQVRLIGLSGAYKGNEYFLKKDEYVIGRSQDCDMVLDENTISGKHAKITRVGDHFEIFDLNSTNGTYVNGVKIDKKPLRTDDKIKFDVFEFQYIHPTEVARTMMAQAPDFEKAPGTMVRPQASQPVAPPQPQAPPPPPPQQQAPPPAAQQAAQSQARPSELIERERAQPRIQTAAFERGGSLIAGLIVGLLVAFMFSLGGLVMSMLVKTNFQFFDIVETLKGVVRFLPAMHLHTSWMNVNWDVGQIIVAVCLPLSLLLGGVITQSISRNNRFGTAVAFSILYVLIAVIAMFAVVGFNFETLKYGLSISANLGITDPLINMLAVFGYFFGVTFVISFIGTLLGRK